MESVGFINRKILKLALPNIVSNITIPLLGLVDTALMGHLDNVAYLGAIALGSMIFNVIYWSLGFLRMGTVGFTAQALGADDKKQQLLIFRRGILISLILSTIIILLHPWIIQLGIDMTRSGEEVKIYAQEYVRIRIWAAPASLALLVFSGWFLGMHNAVFPMLIAVFGNILNIAFSYVLVYHFNLNSAGAAWGTVGAQWLSFCLAIYLFHKKFFHLKRKTTMPELLNISELGNFFKVNGNIFIRTLGIIFVISFFTIQSANINDYILAINTILFQFFLFFSFMLDGFANAAEAMTGEYIGSKSLSKLKLTVRMNMLFGLGFSLIFSLIYFLFGDFIFSLLTSNEEVIRRAKPLLFWVVIMPPISFAAFIYDGIFIGATASQALRNGMFIAVVMVFVPIFFLTPLPEISKLWIAFLSFMAARGATLAFMMKKSVYGQIEANDKKE